MTLKNSERLLEHYKKLGNEKAVADMEANIAFKKKKLNVTEVKKAKD